MRKVETGRFYGTKSVKEADDGQDSRTALSALLTLVHADGMWIGSGFCVKIGRILCGYSDEIA